MEFCLLCLESRKEFDNCIKVNSETWNKQDIQFLIDKYLWPMDTISITSWMCTVCVEELLNFHKFYRRIEFAHKNLVKTETEEFNTMQIEPEIVIQHPITSDYELNIRSIKSEQENVESMDILSKCIVEKCHNIKDVTKEKFEIIKDPLEKIKIPKRSKMLLHKVKKLRLKAKKSNSSKRYKNDFGLNEKMTETLELDREIVKPISPTEDDKDKSNTLNISKNKIKQRNNPDGETLKEYDRIIAENFQIECHLCKIPFEDFITLRKHFRIVHKQRGYARCCNRNFTSRSVLVDHIHVHMNPEHFKCQECGKVFSDRSTLVGHMKLHDDVSKLEKCNECGKVFVSSAKLKTHLLTHTNTEKMFPCNICGKFYTNTSILNRHKEAVHEKKFVQICNVCGKSISCPSAFASHMESHEMKTTPLSCDVCGLLLSNKLGLKLHKNSQHPEGGKKDHKCHICSKISPTLRALKSHIQHAHEMGYDYKCNLCSKAFKRAATLKEHMATHTGTALYSCPWCPKTFISNGNMYNHRKNVHPKEWAQLQRQKYADGDSFTEINN